MLAEYLAAFGMKVVTAGDGQEALDTLAAHPADAVVLDVMMPRLDGFSVCRKLRAEGNGVPVLMLTARGELPDKVAGLEIGADDYLSKPFEPREVVARLQALLRRAEGTQRRGLAKRLRSGELLIDPSTQSAWLGGNPLDLTTQEFEVLHLFMSSPGEVLSRDHLMDRLRGIDWDALNRSVDVAISRLRGRLHDDVKRPKYLKTVRGSGYLWLPAVKPEDVA